MKLYLQLLCAFTLRDVGEIAAAEGGGSGCLSLRITRVAICSRCAHPLSWSRSGAFDRWVHRWAKYGHPGLPTLGITSTQRVESTNSALKPAMQRSGTMVDVHRAISKKVQSDANKTTRWATVNLWGAFRTCCLRCVNIDGRGRSWEAKGSCLPACLPK